MSKKSRSGYHGLLACPRCGQETFDFERKVVGADGITEKANVYWCGNSACDVDEKGKWEGGHFWTLDEIERFNAERAAAATDDAGSPAH